MSWKPNVEIGYLKDNLRKRANMIRCIRNFFYSLEVMEVETPIMSSASVTDIHLHPISLNIDWDDRKTFYLHTSPEYHMKRLLAAGFDSIFQITKVFRAMEKGSKHNVEFSMLEWYRINFSLDNLIDEVISLLKTIFKEHKFEVKKISYREIFEKFFDINPHKKIRLKDIKSIVASNIKNFPDNLDYQSYLDLLFSHIIEPSLKGNYFYFIYDFPAAQATMEKIDNVDGDMVAKRFELFINSIEIANGYDEMSDHNELKKRINTTIKRRKILCMPYINPDINIIAAHEHGLPKCSGVALGIDRLAMTLINTNEIKDVLSFTFDQA